jgi:hypothetical protein
VTLLDNQHQHEDVRDEETSESRESEGWGSFRLCSAVTVAWTPGSNGSSTAVHPARTLLTAGLERNAYGHVAIKGHKPR